MTPSVAIGGTPFDPLFAVIFTVILVVIVVLAVRHIIRERDR